VNTAILLHGTSGSATATRQVVDALRHIEDTDVREVSPSKRGRSSLANAVRDARWDLWQASRAVPDTDLLVSPCNIGLRGRARKHLLVVHDVMAIERPELFDRRFAAYFRLLVPRSIRSADRVLTLSEPTAARVRQMAPGTDVRIIRWAHTGGETPPQACFPDRPVVLMVGAVEPVKNHAAGVRAVARLRSETGADIGLRVLGPTGRAEAELLAALRAEDPAASWTSREVDVADAVLDSAYGSSWLLLQSSYDEGFGLPLVEAARHGLPVVHSGRGGMPSVLADINAEGVHPAALALAMQPLLDADRWARASKTALKRAEEFTPEAFHASLHDAVSDLLPPRR
jgi:glycosyltransferase involved in cell wall biosynthesis